MTEDMNSTSPKHIKASVKEALGKLTGDAGVEAEGRRQKREARSTKTAVTAPAGSDRD
ncbi:CsbD family protein [Methylobacterium sp. C33D]